MSCRNPRSRRQMLSALLVGLAACGDSCSTGITPSDAAPYQACAQDSDCIMVASACTDCNAPVAINSVQLQNFEGFRGCWPDQAGADNQCPGGSGGFGGCGSTLCARGRCVVASSCFGGTTSTVAAVGGFGTSSFSTATSTTSGFTTFTFTTATTTGGGSFSICAGCASSSDCASDYCDFALGRGFCDSLSFCTDQACAPFPCDANTGLCSCGGTSSTTGSTGGLTATSSTWTATSGSGSSGMGGAGSSGSDSGPTGGSSSGAGSSSGEIDGGPGDAG